MTDAARRERFEAAYRELYAPICGYALRRVHGAGGRGRGDCRDVRHTVAAFQTAAPGGEFRPWLFGVARRVIANQRRGEQRRSALGERLAANLDPGVPAYPEEAPSGLARAFASLSDSDRELLSLVAWEGLMRDELAVALGTSRAVVRLRLHRATKRLRAALPPTQVRLTGGQEHEWT